MNPFDYQLEAVKRISDTRYFLLADQMGLGKSFTSLLSARDYLSTTCPTNKALVICPAFLQDTWKNEINKCVSEYKDRIDVHSYNYITTNYSLVSQYQFIIIDEAHYLKNHRAKRTNNIIAAIKKYNPEKVVLLSGTPIKNRVPEFYTLLYLLYLPMGNFTYSYTRFCETFSNPQLLNFGGKRIMRYEGHRNVDQLKELLKPVYLRRTLDTIKQQLPDLIRKEIFIDSKEVQEELKEAWDEYHKNRGSLAFASVKMGNAITKAEYTVTYVDNLLEEDSELPLLIFSDHVGSARAVYCGLKNKIKCGLITGATAIGQRNDIINDFQSGKIQILVATIGTTSVGYTFTRANNIIFNDLPWVSTDLDQAEKRIHRIGQQKTCYIHFISYGKIDSYINQKLMFKRELLKEVL